MRTGPSSFVGLAKVGRTCPAVDEVRTDGERC